MNDVNNDTDEHPQIDVDDEDSQIDEGPLSVDLDELGGDDETDVVPCPSCGEEVYEDADRCEACGHYFTPGQEPESSLSWSWILLIVAAIVAGGYYLGRLVRGGR